MQEEKGTIEDEMVGWSTNCQNTERTPQTQQFNPSTPRGAGPSHTSSEAAHTEESELGLVHPEIKLKLQYFGHLM